MNYRALLATMVMSVSLIGANSAQAGAEVGSWYIAPKAVYVDPDRLQRVVDAGTAYKVGDALGASFGIGKVLNQNWDGEVNHVYSVHGAGTDTAATSYKSWEGVLNRVFSRDKSLSPFVGFGLNSTTYSLTTAPSTVQANTAREWGYLVKTGVMVDIGGLNDIKNIPTVSSKGSMQLVAEIGWRADGGLKGCEGGNAPCALSGATRYFQNTFFGLGLRYNFGTRSASKVTSPVAGAPVENPDPVSVHEPVKAAVLPPPTAPADSDRDGVVDPSDRCANTPIGDKVDTVGCSLSMVLKIQFDFDDVMIKPDFIGELDQFVQFLKDVPSARGVLEGHTDPVGSDEYNQLLSERRAEAVLAYVISKGVDAARLQTKGYGETMPVADNDTAEGRMANRRVQFSR